MADKISKEQRSKIMSCIRSSNTKMEVLLRSCLWRKGYRFRANVSNLPGKPDIAIKKYTLAIFLDSCFWHSCPKHFRMPKSNKRYWVNKIKRNKARDKEINSTYKKMHWRMFRFWEHEISSSLPRCVKLIESAIKKARR